MRYKLGEIFDLQMGKTPDRHSPKFWNEGTEPWISIADLSKCNKYIESTAEKITMAAVEESGIKIIPKNTVIMSFKLSIGKVAITPKEMYSNEAIMSFIDKGVLRIEPVYLYYLLMHKDWDSGTNKAVMGKTLNKATLSQMSVNIHKYSEQLEIIKVLDAASSLIAARKQQLAELDNLIKARFVEMFGDMIINEMGWHEITLDTLADVVSGITKGRKVREKELIEVPYMAVSNVKDGYIDWTTVKTIMATKQEIEQYRLLPYDVLMTEGGDPDKLGRGAVIVAPPENSIHQNHIFRVRLQTDRILPIYFSQYLQNQKAKKYFLGCAKQTTGIASINMKQLRSLPVLVPPMELQNQFAAFVEQVDKSKVVVQKALDEAQTLFDSLMQEYFG